jgi:exodeoxyribonuclease VII small subunit
MNPSSPSKPHSNLENSSSEGSPNSEQPFERLMEQLQAAVKKLESGELSLEDSLKQFEEGIKLARLCQSQLGAAEQRVEILTRSSTSNEVELQPFPLGRSNGDR